MLDEAVIKDLCERITQESDARRAADLLTSLRFVIELENDETRLRIRQILQHYRKVKLEILPEKRRSPMVSFLASLVRGQGVPPLDK